MAGLTNAEALADMTLDIDPAGSTVEVNVGGTWYAATWLGSATTSGTKWKQTARTVIDVRA